MIYKGREDFLAVVSPHPETHNVQLWFSEVSLASLVFCALEIRVHPVHTQLYRHMTWQRTTLCVKKR